MLNPQRKLDLKNFKLLAVTLFLVHAMCAVVLSQTSSPRITPEPPVGKGVVVLRAARLIDGTGAAPINNAVVVVTDNTISAVGAASSVRIPANARSIDLGDVTLMPGFIDAHTHLMAVCSEIPPVTMRSLLTSNRSRQSSACSTLALR